MLPLYPSAVPGSAHQGWCCPFSCLLSIPTGIPVAAQVLRQLGQGRKMAPSVDFLVFLLVLLKLHSYCERWGGDTPSDDFQGILQLVRHFYIAMWGDDVPLTISINSYRRLLHTV